MATIKMKTLLIEDELYTQPIVNMGYLREQLTKYVNRWVDFPLYDYNNKEEFIKIKSVDIKKIEPQMYFVDATNGSTGLYGGCSLFNKANYNCIRTENLSFLTPSSTYFTDISNINYVAIRNLLKRESDEEGNPIELKNDLVGIEIRYESFESSGSSKYYNYNYNENNFDLIERAKYVQSYITTYGNLDFNENGYRTGVNKWLMVIFYYDMIIQKKDGTDDIYLQVPAILPLHILNDFEITYGTVSMLSRFKLKNDIIIRNAITIPDGQLKIYYNNRYLYIKKPDGSYVLFEPKGLFNDNNINIADFIEFYNMQNIVVTFNSMFTSIPRELLENEENF